MPLFRPTAHTGSLVKLSPGDKPKCAACPDAWFWISFDTEAYAGPVGVYVLMDDGSFRHLRRGLQEVLDSGFPPDRVFPVGTDGYYLTMAQARQAIDPDHVTSVYYVDDFNDEWQDYFICDDTVEPFPYVEAHVKEPIQ
jgi:hypothetical protein